MLNWRNPATEKPVELAKLIVGRDWYGGEMIYSVAYFENNCYYYDCTRQKLFGVEKWAYIEEEKYGKTH